MDSGVRAHEIKHVLDRMAGGKSYGAPGAPSQPASTRSDAPRSDAPRSGAHSLRSDVREAGSARAAMRAALRRALGGTAATERDDDDPSALPGSPAPPRTTDGSPAPPPTPAPGPPRSDAESRPPTPSAPPREVPTAPRPAPPAHDPAVAADPTYTVSIAKGQAWLAVRWRSVAALGYVLHSQLSRGVLSLAATAEPLPTEGRLTILLQFESIYVQAAGRLIDGGPFGATSQGRSPPGLAALEAAIRPRSTASDARTRFRRE